MRLRIGVDLGGTKIEALALDADGRELRRLRVPILPKHGASSGVRGAAWLWTAREARVES